MLDSPRDRDDFLLSLRGLISGMFILVSGMFILVSGIFILVSGMFIFICLVLSRVMFIDSFESANY